MNEKDKAKLRVFLHFYIKTFLNDAIDEFSNIQNKNWETLKYLVDSGGVLIEVLHIVQKEVQEEYREILDKYLDEQLIKIGK